MAVDIKQVIEDALLEQVNVVLGNKHEFFAATISCDDDVQPSKRTVYLFEHRLKKARMYSLASTEQSAWGALRLSLTQQPSRLSTAIRKEIWDGITRLKLDQELKRDPANLKRLWRLTVLEYDSTQEATMAIKEAVENPNSQLVLNTGFNPRNIREGTPGGTRRLRFTVDITIPA